MITDKRTVAGRTGKRWFLLGVCPKQVPFCTSQRLHRARSRDERHSIMSRWRSCSATWMHQLTTIATGNAFTCLFRLVIYLLLAWSTFWVAMYRGLWYDRHVFARKDSAFEFEAAGFHVSGGKARILLFFAGPVILATLLGACWEAAWYARQANYTLRRRTRAPSNTPSVNSSSKGWQLWTRSLLQYNFRVPGSSQWMTVTEGSALVILLLALAIMVHQGVEYKMASYYSDTMVCADDRSLRCYEGTDERTTSSSLTRLKNIAKYMGFAATILFSVVLVPVSRDSKIWSGMGQHVERVVFYHTVLGHVACSIMALHGVLYMLYYVLKHDSAYAIHKAFHYGGSGVNVPAGLAAGLFMLPMWIFSLPYMRRRFFVTFKTVHLLFAGVITSAVVHYSGVVYYLLPGFVLYLVHLIRRQSNGKWWSTMAWLLFRGRSGARSSVVHVTKEAGYTRLVLRSPGECVTRGGMLVYIRSSSLLGTLEWHPMSVALRGAPPSLWGTSYHRETVFTLYIKAVGRWTRALNEHDASDLVVDVDGCYAATTTLASTKEAGYQRVLLFAGGSGVTSFLALIQDWCEAHAEGEDVPDMHLVWTCRRLEELKLVGEALSSFASSAGTGPAPRLRMSLFCSGKETSKSLSVAWPTVDAPRRTGHIRGISSLTILDSLNSGISTVVAGVGATLGWLWAQDMVDDHVLKALLTVALMAAVPVVMLLLYDWATSACGRLFPKTPFCGSLARRYQPLVQKDVSFSEETIDDGTSSLRVLPVTAGRMPIQGILRAELDYAERDGIGKVKILVSGPSGLVDSVVMESKKVSWRVFDTEVYSRAV